MMRLCWGIGLVVLLGVVAPPAAVAQSEADAYFHRAAQRYVAEDYAAAQRAVERGLEVAPSDPRLQALRKKLRQGGRSGGDTSDSTEGAGTDESAESASDEGATEGEEGAESDEEGPSGGAQDDGASAPPVLGAQGRSSSQRGRDAPRRADTVGQGQGGTPVDTLSRAQAERLLQALQGKERQLLRRVQARSTESKPVEKDW